MEKTHKTNQTKEMDRSKKLTKTKIIILLFIGYLFITGCNMTLKKPTRVIKLLEYENINLIASNAPPPIELSDKYWGYSVTHNDINIWVFEFNGQQQLDEGIIKNSTALMENNQHIDLAQNGEYLLVIVFKNSDQEEVNMILEAFSGEVEH